MSLIKNAITMGTKSTKPSAFTIKMPAGQTSAQVDFRPLFQNLEVENIQSVYIDNSKNPAPLSLTVSGTDQTISINGSLQGYYPLLMPSNGDIVTIQTTENPYGITLIFSNVFIQAGSTQNQSPGTSSALDSNGYLYTDIGAVSSSLANSDGYMYVDVSKSPYLYVLPYPDYYFAVSANFDANSATNPIFTEEINSTGFQVGTATQSTATASTLVPARSGVTGFIDKITIIETANATLATAAVIDLEIIDGATVIASIPVYVPTAAISGSYAPITLDLKYNQLAADSALTVNLSAALATGEFYLIANYK